MSEHLTHDEILNHITAIKDLSDTGNEYLLESSRQAGLLAVGLLAGISFFGDVKDVSAPGKAAVIALLVSAVGCIAAHFFVGFRAFQFARRTANHLAPAWDGNPVTRKKGSPGIVIWPAWVGGAIQLFGLLAALVIWVYMLLGG